MAKNAALLDTVRKYLRLDGKKCDSLAEIAKALHTDAPSLSRYRNNDRILSEAKARAWASILAGKKPSHEFREQITQELLATLPDRRQDMNEAQRWIAGLGNPNRLLLVEFREPPAVSPEGDNHNLAGDVALSLMRGLSYGMCFPFGWKVASNQALPMRIRSFLESVQRAILRTIQTIQRDIADHVCDGKSLDELEEQKDMLISRIKESLDRLKLYHLTDDQPESICPGLGFRTFLVDGFDEKGEEALKRELWQWISTPTGERMVLKADSGDLIEITMLRFYPLPQYFAQHLRLPTSTEIKEYVENDLVERPFLTPDSNGGVWTSYKTGDTGLLAKELFEVELSKVKSA